MYEKISFFFSLGERDKCRLDARSFTCEYIASEITLEYRRVCVQLHLAFYYHFINKQTKRKITLYLTLNRMYSIDKMFFARLAIS